MEDHNNYLGYLKYSGKLVEKGFLDARKSAQALLGFDEAIRYFVNLQSPQLGDIQYEIPIKIGKGSWEALIPDTIGDWIKAAAGIAITTYITTMVKKLAENNFKDIGVKEIFRNSLSAIKWFIKIGKHLGNLTQKKFKNVKWRNNNKEIGIPNNTGEILFIPVNYYETYVASRSNLLSKISEIVESERILTIGIIKPTEVEEENIIGNEKYIFYDKEEDDDYFLFPELTHGKKIELEGDITRGNEPANSIGFRYKDHILTCYPEKGSIVNYKNALFLKCKIIGAINRLDKFGKITEKRPKIVFSEILPLENDDSNLPLFEKTN